MSAPRSQDPPAETTRTAHLSSDSLRAQARDAIRASIVSGDLHAGRTYTVGKFAKHFGVSATPIREAVGDLAAEGLVRALPNRGFAVLELSDGDLHELHEIRELLEVPSIEQLARRSGLVLDGPAASLNEFVECARRQDVPGLLQADREFHLGLLRLTDNGRLVDVVTKLLNQQRMHRLPSDRASKHELELSAVLHSRILAAIENGDSQAARQLMEEHFNYARGRTGPAQDRASAPEADGR